MAGQADGAGATGSTTRSEGDPAQGTGGGGVCGVES
jgi:hypothetical protein